MSFILNPYIFKKTQPNTFIGGIGATINTPALLAARLSISEASIKNFQIDDNNNVSCNILHSYSINGYAFRSTNHAGLRYWIDFEEKCVGLGEACFEIRAENNPYWKVMLLPGVLSSLNGTFRSNTNSRGRWDLISLPKLTPIGASGTIDNANFQNAQFNYNVYVNSSNETINAGNPDPDLLVSGLTGKVKYSYNQNKPMAPDNISTLGKGDSWIEIAWSAVSHSNSIDHYLVFANGEYKGRTGTTSFIITDLIPNSNNEIKILALDEMGNASKFSSIYKETTL